ncbi:unnamed protein product [Darwinula stevensoni]|uniref:Uncharacterized protein n=1 Tax=Darwinula stevensoni TaxID=69355 RepID=A0A7R9AFK6_9CRUS|nr:unnamed protein product [Darwinula stevensoni]CAG0902953.1 unnamed protein product [Darwinula stevensoni]
MAILPSKERIWKLQITNSALGDFPWDILPQFSNLTHLFLYGNPLTTLPRLDSASLKQLILFQDEIATIESVSSLPNLEVLHMASNPLSEIPIGFFSVLGNLDMFFCQSCSLGPTLATGILTFGFGPETTIHLQNNELTELTEEVFRPMVQILSQGSGTIQLSDNPVDCGCSIAWWVLNPQFHWTVQGQCADGNFFQSLNTDDYQDCIRDGQIHSA